MTLAALVLFTVASAQDTPPQPTDAVTEETAETAVHQTRAEKRAERPLKLGGIALPLVNYNTTDQLGFGAGAELYTRQRDDEYGYIYRVSVATFWTTSGNYTSNYLNIEHRGRDYWVARVIYRAWKNMTYVGSGGADVALQRAPEQALGNVLYGPTVLFNLVRPIRNSPVSLWGQVYGRFGFSRALEGGLLEQRDPIGARGASYLDASVGLWIQEIDRYPLPNKGVQLEVDVRAGVTVPHDGGPALPLVGAHAELIAWHPLVGERLTLGFRSVIDKPFGERPYFEQEFVGGIQRDEIAYEQVLMGYGRSRSRGDGVWATMLELRPKIAHTRDPVFDLALYISAFAEVGFLFDGAELGPVLPTVGIAPVLVWQGAIPLRPFVAWGWTRESEDGPRRPGAMVGISLLGSL